MVQDNWRSCDKCQGLYFAGAVKSVCPAGGKHKNVASISYVLSDSTLPLPVKGELLGYSEWDALSVICPAPPKGDGGNTGINVVSKGVYAPDDVHPLGIRVETDGLGFGVVATAEDGDALNGTSRSGVGVRGTSQTGRGVAGDSQKDTGVFGSSSTGRGVWGISDSFFATVGDSTSNTGVYGHSVRGTGVEGRSDGSGDGVTGWSGNGSGVAGISLRGNGIYGRTEDDLFGNAGYFEGNVRVTGDICLGDAAGDCAEDFDVVDITEATPGTVMVLDERGAVRASHQPYDSHVAGVVSGAGKLRPGIILDRGSSAPNRRPLALIGKVYCKVDAGFGSIGIGDMLTTSATPGYAMKVVDRTKAFGAVIGKALEALTEGTGLIPVLVGLR